MLTVDEVLALHPLSVTVRPTVLVPDAGQVTVYGPAPLPLTTVPPPKLHVYVAVADTLVTVAVTFCPVQADVGLSAKAALAESTVTVLVAVVMHPLSVTVTEIVLTPAILQFTLYGPPPLPLVMTAPDPKLHVYVAVPDTVLRDILSFMPLQIVGCDALIVGGVGVETEIVKVLSVLHR